MTRLIERSDVIDYQTYEDIRADRRSQIFEVKRPRRIHLGEYLTFLFENRETLTYQVQEIIRAETIVRESAILDEIEVYNKFLGEAGDLACVLLIEIAEESDRKPLLRRWLGLEKAIYVRVKDGSKIYASYEEAQVDDDRLSAVQYLTFALNGRTPVAVGTDFDELAGEVELTSEQQTALSADLAE
ncbi:MAG: DUF3501 family protein [Actinomycetia bacterium]|nr:DUF3501 family protein [Actinomycetes bacterium]MCP4959723.1 DUF3501 family protein [Actinomycetes bacterium]